MLNRIIAFSIKNKLIIGLFVIALIGFGAYEVKRLPIDAVPDITNNQVQVITVAPALGATDIERLITFPLEQANSNVPGLVELRSYSSFGLSVITIVFDDDVDIYWARQQIAERLQQVHAERQREGHREIRRVDELVAHQPGERLLGDHVGDCALRVGRLTRNGDVTGGGRRAHGLVGFSARSAWMRANVPITGSVFAAAKLRPGRTAIWARSRAISSR